MNKLNNNLLIIDAYQYEEYGKFFKALWHVTPHLMRGPFYGS